MKLPAKPLKGFLPLEAVERLASGNLPAHEPVALAQKPIHQVVGVIMHEEDAKALQTQLGTRARVELPLGTMRVLGGDLEVETRPWARRGWAVPVCSCGAMGMVQDTADPEPA